jgi:hypothetical protein
MPKPASSLAVHLRPLELSIWEIVLNPTALCKCAKRQARLLKLAADRMSPKYSPSITLGSASRLHSFAGEAVAPHSGRSDEIGIFSQ